MKSWVLGGSLAALGFGYTLTGDTDDVHRTVRLPIAKVYDGFDRAFTPNGPTSIEVSAGQSPDGIAGTMRAIVERVEDKSLLMTVEFHDKKFMTFELNFTPGKADTTEVSGNLDLDAGVLSPRGDGVGAPPSFIVDQMANVAATRIVDKVIGDLYAGRDPRSQPATFWLPKRDEYPGMTAEARAFHESVGEGASRREEQYRLESQMREAGRPMVDPNAVAKRNSGEW